jgi:D-galactarolactone cycloisomerase
MVYDPKSGLPLWRMLGGTNPKIGVYASGINPDGPEAVALAHKSQGFTAFKLKIGFGQDRDIRNIRELRCAMGDEACWQAPDR